MNCPKCQSQLLARETQDAIEIDRCPRCHGIWLDALELERLVEVMPSSLISDDARFRRETHDEASRINCPNCKGTYLIKLNSRLRPGVILDSCTVCFGNWLDAGELSRLTESGFRAFLLSLFR